MSCVARNCVKITILSGNSSSNESSRSVFALCPVRSAWSAKAASCRRSSSDRRVCSDKRRSVLAAAAAELPSVICSVSKTMRFRPRRGSRLAWLSCFLPACGTACPTESRWRTNRVTSSYNRRSSSLSVTASVLAQRRVNCRPTVLRRLRTITSANNSCNSSTFFGVSLSLRSTNRF